MDTQIDPRNTRQDDDRYDNGRKQQPEGWPPELVPGYADKEAVENDRSKDVAAGEAVSNQELRYVDQVWDGRGRSTKTERASIPIKVTTANNKVKAATRSPSQKKRTKVAVHIATDG